MFEKAAISHHAVVPLVSAAPLNRLLHSVDQLVSINALLAHSRERAVDLEPPRLVELRADGVEARVVAVPLRVNCALIALDGERELI